MCSEGGPCFPTSYQEPLPAEEPPNRLTSVWAPVGEESGDSSSSQLSADTSGPWPCSPALLAPLWAFPITLHSVIISQFTTIPEPKNVDDPGSLEVISSTTSDRMQIL